MSRRRAAPAPPVRIEVAVDVCAWRRGVPRVVAAVRRACRAALATGAPRLGSAELSLVLTDDRRLRALNRRWRGHDKPTNVLSFPTAGARRQFVPAAGQPRLLGDVVVGFGVAAAEAETEGKQLPDHLAHLVVHGVLHLLGYDHARAGQARRMESLERRILAGLGVADPYQTRARDDRA
jgi:probable rRNA maturation factor